MAKKQRKPLLAKKQKINWKLVAIVLGVLLVGVSLWALKSNLSYKSKAAEPTLQQQIARATYLCKSENSTCKRECSGGKIDSGNSNGANGGNIDGSAVDDIPILTAAEKKACKKGCKSALNACIAAIETLGL